MSVLQVFRGGVRSHDPGLVFSFQDLTCFQEYTAEHIIDVPVQRSRQCPVTYLSAQSTTHCRKDGRFVSSELVDEIPEVSSNDIERSTAEHIIGVPVQRSRTSSELLMKIVTERECSSTITAEMEIIRVVKQHFLFMRIQRR